MIAKPIFGRGSKNLFHIKNKKDYLFFKRKKNFIIQNLIKKEKSLPLIVFFNDKR